MSTQLSNIWYLPEILHCLSKHVHRKDLVQLTLVCRSWNNAFAPILWSIIHFGKCQESVLETIGLETLRSRSAWFRTLEYHSRVDLKLLSLGDACRNLQSLTLSCQLPFKTEYAQGYSKACQQLLRQNRESLRRLELKHWTFNKGVEGLVIPEWYPVTIFAFEKYTQLRELRAVDCIFYGEYEEAFWTLCERLEVLVLDGGLYGLPKEQLQEQPQSREDSHYSSYSNMTNTHMGTDPLRSSSVSKRFPKMVELTLIQTTASNPNDYLHRIVAQCPRLRRLKWTEYIVSSLPTRLMAKYLTHPEMRAQTWPDLECLETNIGLFKDNLLSIVDIWPEGKLRDANRLIYKAPSGVIGRLLQKHSDSLHTIDLRWAHSPKKYLYRFLELCPMLEKVAGTEINLEAFIGVTPEDEDERPAWVCHRLKEWNVFVNVDPRSTMPALILDHSLERQEYWCRKVFERLGRLKQLRVLDMRKWNQSIVFETAENCYPKETQLHLSLQMGLDELGGLTKLREVYFQGQQTMMRRSDVKWMLKHWVNLEVIEGGSFSNKKERFAGKKTVWDYEYNRMFHAKHVEARSTNVMYNGYPDMYLTPKELGLLAAANDEVEPKRYSGND
ncbi:hypothetical protein FBU30_010812 [Linnemannia zychae]|nr:hypothetical protein FBU30_010812 [Linnemannia zychae]